MLIKLKYDLYIDDQIIYHRLQVLINQVYKLLPIRQEDADWKKPLQTIIEQLCGMQRLINDYGEIFFSLLSKLEGLFSLTELEDFSLYRRTIFQCLGLINTLQKNIVKEEPQ